MPRSPTDPVAETPVRATVICGPKVPGDPVPNTVVNAAANSVFAALGILSANENGKDRPKRAINYAMRISPVVASLVGIVSVNVPAVTL